MPTVCNPRSQNSQVQPILRQAAAVFRSEFIFATDTLTFQYIKWMQRHVHSGVF